METLELRRMDSDGAPARDDHASFIGVRVGVAPPPPPDDPPVATATAAESPDDDPTTSWKAYSAWRRLKCPVRNLDDPAERLTEIDHATAEFVGEVAEVCELIQQEALGVLQDGPARDKLIDECGDAIFCGLWALDAWGVNGLAAHDRAGIGAFEALTIDEFDAIAGFMLTKDRSAESCWSLLAMQAITAAAQAGLLCNAYKKEAFQGRRQDRDTQELRVLAALYHINIILVMARAYMADAIKVNVAKLNARYPNGNTPDGGIRT